MTLLAIQSPPSLEIRASSELKPKETRISKLVLNLLKELLPMLQTNACSAKTAASLSKTSVDSNTKSSVFYTYLQSVQGALKAAEALPLEDKNKLILQGVQGAFGAWTKGLTDSHDTIVKLEQYAISDWDQHENSLKSLFDKLIQAASEIQRADHI
jgi:hypothetical protein